MFPACFSMFPVCFQHVLSMFSLCFQYVSACVQHVSSMFSTHFQHIVNMFSACFRMFHYVFSMFSARGICKSSPFSARSSPHRFANPARASQRARATKCCVTGHGSPAAHAPTAALTNSRHKTIVLCEFLDAWTFYTNPGLLESGHRDTIVR